MKFDTELHYIHIYTLWGVWGGSVLQAGRSRVRFTVGSLEFFHWLNPLLRTLAVGLTECQGIYPRG